MYYWFLTLGALAFSHFACPFLEAFQLSRFPYRHSVIQWDKTQKDNSSEAWNKILNSEVSRDRLSLKSLIKNQKSSKEKEILTTDSVSQFFSRSASLSRSSTSSRFRVVPSKKVPKGSIYRIKGDTEPKHTQALPDKKTKSKKHFSIRTLQRLSPYSKTTRPSSPKSKKSLLSIPSRKQSKSIYSRQFRNCLFCP